MVSSRDGSWPVFPGSRKISKWLTRPETFYFFLQRKLTQHFDFTGCWLFFKLQNQNKFLKKYGFSSRSRNPEAKKNNPAQNPEFTIFDPEPCPEPWFRVLNVKTHECDSNLVGSYLNPVPSYASSKVRNCQMCRSGTEGLTYFSPFEAQG